MKKLTSQEQAELEKLRKIPQEKRTPEQDKRYTDLLYRYFDEKLVAWPEDVED